jgi:hypothetical protein
MGDNVDALATLKKLHLQVDSCGRTAGEMQALTCMLTFLAPGCFSLLASNLGLLAAADKHFSALATRLHVQNFPERYTDTALPFLQFSYIACSSDRDPRALIGELSKM